MEGVQRPYQLLAAQRDYGIDSKSPPERYVTCDGSGCGKGDYHSHERQRIDRPNTEKERAQH